MHYLITSLAQSSSPNILKKLGNIFFETSARKDFSSHQEKEEFEYRYFGIYLRNPEFVLFAQDEANDILGYCIGAPRTTLEHFKLHAYLKAFENKIQEYPAHLHINLIEKARSRGVGSQLLAAFEKKCQTEKSFGIHLVTLKEARNVHFYIKNNYREISVKSVNGAKLLLLGKKLSS